MSQPPRSRQVVTAVECNRKSVMGVRRALGAWVVDLAIAMAVAVDVEARRRRRGKARGCELVL